MTGPVLHFGPFTLDPARGRLTRDGTDLPLGQRAVSLLHALAEAGGEVVSKADLIDRAWPGLAVEEGNLTVQIAALRKVLARDGARGDVIVTVPRRGYRLVVAEEGDAAPETVAPSLAVLPFRTQGQADDGYFADGVAEDIITALSRFRSFAVIARNSSFAYRGAEAELPRVAADLGVRYVLTGSLRRGGDRLRITAELADAIAGTVLWSDRFEGAADEVFAFQDRISETAVAIAAPQIEAAELARSRRERATSLAAYDVLLRARPLIAGETMAGNAKAHSMLVAALKQEPENPQLLAHAAWVLEHRLTMGWPAFDPDDRARCADYARLGLKVAGGDAVVIAHCGMSLLHGAKEYRLGLAAIRQALALNPNHMTVVSVAGAALVHVGSIDEAIACATRATRLSPRDPLAHIPLCTLAHAHMARRDFAAAYDFAAESQNAQPSFDPGLWMLIAAAAQLGRIDEARRHAARLMVSVPGVTIERLRSAQPEFDPDRMAPIWEGLSKAGVPQG